MSSIKTINNTPLFTNYRSTDHQSSPVYLNNSDVNSRIKKVSSILLTPSSFLEQRKKTDPWPRPLPRPKPPKKPVPRTPKINNPRKPFGY